MLPVHDCLAGPSLLRHNQLVNVRPHSARNFLRLRGEKMEIQLNKLLAYTRWLLHHFQAQMAISYVP